MGNKANKESKDDGDDISRSPLIQCIDTYPKFGYFNLSTLYTQNMIWESAKFEPKSKKNGYLIFDVHNVTVNTISIKLNKEHHASTIKIFTYDKYNKDSDNTNVWEPLATKRAIRKDQYTKFILKTAHKKFIKICIESVKSNTLGIDDLVWNGTENIKIMEITDKIKVYQSSAKNYDSDIESILNNQTKASFMTSFHDPKTFLIFDCKQYEVEKIFIEFGDKSKPEFVKLRLSDVQNAYSFKTAPTVKTWTLETSNKNPDFMSRTWSCIDMRAILDIKNDSNIDIYKHGFKRYLQLEFSVYAAFSFQVKNCRFFGRLSEKITADSIQFDPTLDIDQTYETLDEKKDEVTEDEIKELDSEMKQYKPKVIDFTATKGRSLNYPIGNIFDDSIYSCYHMDIRYDQNNVYNSDDIGFIIVDLGNNNVNNMWILSHYRYPCMICRVFTSDNANGKKWTLLHNDEEFMDPIKYENGVNYDLKGKHKKYIKLEFEKPNQPTYAIRVLKFFGDSVFLDTVKTEISLDDIKNTQNVDEDMVHRYKMQKIEKINLAAWKFEVTEIREQMIDDNYWGKDKFDFGKEWIDRNVEKYKNNAIKCYLSTEMNAYIQPTKFEQEQLLKVSELQKKVAHEYVTKILDAESDENKAIHDLMMEHINTEKKYNNALAKNENQQLITKLKQETEALLTKRREFGPEQKELMIEERDMKLDAVYKDSTTEDIFELWRESVEQDPMKISDKYNVSEYETMIKWATKHKAKEIKQLFIILAKLLKNSMEQRKPLMHKYHLFQLSMYPLENQDAEEFHGNTPPWILFDTKDRKLNRIEFSLIGDVHQYEVYTADEIIEKKNDNNEREIDWNNFTKIQQCMIPDKYFQNPDEMAGIQIPFEDARCAINLMNKRYIKIIFCNKYGYAPYWVFTILQFRAFVESLDEKEIDQVEEEGGVLPKHRLKLIRVISGDYEQANKMALKDTRRRIFYKEFKHVYLSKDTGYMTAPYVKQPFFIFDAGYPLREIERFDIQFGYLHNPNGNVKMFKDRYYFDLFTVSTSDTLNNDNSDIKDNEEWIELFKEETKTDESWENTYDGKIKTINLNCKNKRYLKFSFNLRDKADEMRLMHLKFYTKDSTDYKWDSDENIKNLTKQIEIVETSSFGQEGHNIENIYSNSNDDRGVNGGTFEPVISNYDAIWNNSVKDCMRDEICCVLNKLRNENNISTNEKHYIKFLLCWQHKDHYKEILETAKRVMNILKKPLIKEYNKLQEEKSELLTLSMKNEYRLPENIISNHGLLEWQYNTWYEYRKALFGKDLTIIAKEWEKLGLKLINEDFKHLRRNGIIDKDKSFTSSDELAMEFLNLVAIHLDPSFQQTMKDLFEENRNILSLKYPTDDLDLGVLSGPIKTKARQIIKVKLDYYDKESPQCMSVLDIVRCAIVCENDKELCNLFHLICQKFKGKILRVKNAFDDINKDTYGYRAVLINIAYGNEKILPKGFEMICEIQLLLIKYYKVRKLMHLGYGIVRSEEGGISDNRKPYVVLAQDSCKLGKLDI